MQDDSRQILHVLVTRYSMVMNAFNAAGYLQSKAEKEQWLKSRLPLFEGICLPSVLKQTRRPDLWLIGLDDTRAQEVRQILKLLEPHPWIQPAWQSTIDGHAEPFEKCFRRVIVKHANPDHAWLLTTRLDNDDAINLSFCERVHNFVLTTCARPQVPDEFWVTFPLGMQLADGECALRPQENNTFLSRCARIAKTNRIPPTALAGNHRDVSEKNNTYSIVTRHPMWLQNVHDSNLKNEKYKDLSVFKNPHIELRRFGISTTNLANTGLKENLRRAKTRLANLYRGKS